jgi:DNA-binding response OmpR family regulator
LVAQKTKYPYDRPMKKSNLKILIIEDDLLSRLSLKSRLDYLGEVSVASSKAEAFELIEAEKFDLAFVDLDLDSELAGLEIVPLLFSKNTYAVILSGRESEEIIERAYNLGCRDYLAKPFTKTGLELIVKKYFSVINKTK